MARVTGLTAERMLEIERNTVINAFRNVDGELIFTTYDGRQINIGNLEGRGIVQTDIHYQVSSSGSDTPVGVWFSEIPALTPGVYLWTRTTLHYTDDTTSVIYSVARIGEDGSPSQDAQFPTIPTNLSLVSNTGVFTDQGTMAEIVLEWDPVTQSTTGDFIDLAGYELYQESYSVAKIADGTQVKVLRPSGSSSLYRVLATSKGGVDSDLSPALSVVAATPELILRDPNTPIVDSDQGVVTVRWDGSYLGTQNNDSASYVVVGIQNGSSWVRHGVPLYEMGTVNLASKPKTNVTAKLFAYDRLGRQTGESEAVTVTVEGTPFSSFDDVTQEYLEGIEIQAQNAWDSASAAVKSTLVEYAVGPSEIIAPSSGWSSDTPTRTPGSYIWMRTTVTYGDDSTYEFSPVLLTGNDGADGSPGRSITDVDVMYYSSTSTTTLSGGSWQTTAPDWAEGRYIWTKTVTFYSTGDPTETDPVCITGDKGADGVGVESIVEEYYLSTSATTQSDGSWGTSVPGWVDGRYYWTRSKITYTDGTDDTTTPKNVTGGKGSTGETGVSVTAVVQFYQVLPIESPAPAKPENTYATPPSPWQIFEPDYVEDTNLWVVTRVNFSNSTRSYSEVSKASAYTAASTAQKTNMKILKTVDGLNRVFVSEESPGSGYIGYESLAPRIEPSGTLAEVRRNLIKTPIIETSLAGWVLRSGFMSDGGAAPDQGRVLNIDDNPGGNSYLLTAPGTIMDPVVGDSYSMSTSVRNDGSEAIELRVSFWKSGATGYTPSDLVTIPAGQTRELRLDNYVVEEGVTQLSPRILVSPFGISAPAKIMLWNGWTLERSAVVGPYFDGNTTPATAGDVIQPEDFRWRWVGEENESESVMEGDWVDGFFNSTLYSVAPIVSRKDGKPAVRIVKHRTDTGTQIRVGSNQFTAASGLRGAPGTFIATYHGDPNLEESARRVAVGDPLRSTYAESDGQTLVHKWGDGINPILTSTYRFYLHGSDSEDVWWTDISLYAGFLPDDAEPLHKGDLWFRTGWKEQEVGASTYGVQEVLIWNGQDWVPYKLVVDSLAAANSVTTAILNVEEIWGNSAWLDQLEVGVITTNMLSSKFGDDLDISSNSSITLMVGDGSEENPGRLSELDTEIGKVDSKVEDTTKLITDTGGINDKLDALDSLTDKIQAAFRIESDKVSIIAVEGAPNRLDIYPDAIRMVSGNVTVAEITQEHIEIKAGKFTEAVIGNHLMKTTPDGRTIFTPNSN